MLVPPPAYHAVVGAGHVGAPIMRSADGSSAREATETGPASAATSLPGAGAMNEGVERNASLDAAHDVERVADEVYRIIERRLSVERESLGL